MNVCRRPGSVSRCLMDQRLPPLSTYNLASFPDRSRTVKCYEIPRLTNKMRSYHTLNLYIAKTSSTVRIAHAMIG